MSRRTTRISALLARSILLLGGCALLGLAACGSNTKKPAATAGAPPPASATPDPRIAELQATIAALQQQLAQAQSTPSAATVAASAPPATAVRPSATASASAAATTRAPASRVPTSVPGQRQPIALGANGFAQQDTEVAYAFIVSNPNSDAEIDDSSYQVAAYDANGAVIDTDSGSIDVVFPGEKLAISGAIFAGSAAQKAAKVQVQVKSGKAQASTDKNPLSVGNVNLQATTFSQSVTGVVANAGTSDLKDVQIYAVAYDASGAIIGAGFTFLDFVPGGGSSAAKASLTVTGKPSKVELYATYSPLLNSSN